MTTFDVRVEFRTRGARAWVRTMSFLSLLVGRERATRWAERGIRRLVRWRVGGSKWERLP